MNNGTKEEKPQRKFIVKYMATTEVVAENIEKALELFSHVSVYPKENILGIKQVN